MPAWRTPQEDDGWYCRPAPEDSPCAAHWQQCNECNGTGKIGIQDCAVCSGDGGGFCCEHDLQK